MNFRRSRQPQDRVLSLDERVRQGRIVNFAWTALACTDAVRSFLNTHHEGLRGRPLDLATDSHEGLIAVEAAIGEESLRLAISCRPGTEALRPGAKGQYS